jgi:hypothetical protein
MTPQMNRQERIANEAKQPNMLQNIIKTPAGRRLPGEVLQTIFRYLPCLDLVRCMEVCTVWRANLPGDDPVLKEMLFLESRNTSTKPLHISFDIEVRGTVARLQTDVIPQLIYGLRVQTRHSRNIDMWHPVVRGMSFPLHLANTNLTLMHFRNDVYDYNHIAFFTLDELRRKT